MIKNKKGISLIVLIITIIVMIILAASVIISLSNNGIIFNANKAKEEYLKKDLTQSIEIALAERKIDKTLTVKEALDTLQNVEVVQKAPDMYYVTKDNITITVYDDGTIYKSKVEIWDGESVAVPEIKDGNWYIYTPAELKFFQEIVNGAGNLTEQQQQLLTTKGYTAETVEITETTVAHIMADIDMGARQKNGELISGAEWTPIGTNKANTYLGKVEGHNHIILGVYIKTEDNFVGIFGRANGVKDLTVKDSYIEGAGCVGGIVGINSSGIIENCHNINTTIVTNYNTAGGVVGQTSDVIRNCTNSGNVMANYNELDEVSQTGGICGFAKSSVYDCINYGNVTGELSTVGGICGGLFDGLKMDNCANYGRIVGKVYFTGGLIGATGSNVVIISCNNLGEVRNVKGYVGGIIGYSGKNNNILNCTNTGSILGNDKDVGGIIGRAQASNTLNNCTNTGKIVGEKGWIGGIVGWTFEFATITACNNTGEIQGKEKDIAGIAGGMGDNSVILNCTNSGKVTGSGVYIGGIAGWASIENNIDKCINSGEIYVEGYYVGGTVGYLDSSSTVSNCTNYATLKNTGTNTDNKSYIGGIIGGLGTQGTINACKNTGDILGIGTHVGGIIAVVTQEDNKSGSTITNCYNTAQVKGKSLVGGMIGLMGGSQGTGVIKGCYNIGQVIGETDVGGIIGSSSQATLEQMSYCYYLSTSATKGIGNVADADDVIQLMSTTDMKKQAFATKLNLATNLGEWIGEDGKYPILKFEQSK